jgi:5-enolpyruvylshikimate-3-phosphate synthase
MASAILAMFAEGRSIIRDTDCVNTSYPGFYETLRKLSESTPSDIPVISSLRIL